MGDCDKGQKLFKKMCTQCHTIDEGGKNQTGPNLFGMFGRQSGQQEGFNYTDANKNKGELCCIFLILSFNDFY